MRLPIFIASPVSLRKMPRTERCGHTVRAEIEASMQSPAAHDLDSEIFWICLELPQVSPQGQKPSAPHSRNESEFICSAKLTEEKVQQEGGGRLYRLCSSSVLGMGGPVGAIRGYEVGASKATVRTTGGIQLAALLFRRCRLCSGAECLCNVCEA
jgi:hypothetical protein